ncbi:MAG: hypothetical protein ABIZ49_14035 [Opitutaceae bacterium]
MNDLDETMRQTLAESAPRAVQDRVQPRFDALRARFNHRQKESVSGSPLSRGIRAWWWTTLGVFGAAALTFLLVLPHASLRAEVDFVGILSSKDTIRFFLQDRAAGTSSGWVTLNQEFAGFMLLSYDAKTDVLVLTKGQEHVEIRLKDAKVQTGRIELRGTVKLGALGETLEMERVTLVLDQENVFTLKNGVEIHATPKRMPDGNLMWTMAYLRPRTDGTKESLSTPKWITLPDRQWAFLIGSPETPNKNLSFTFTPPPK